MRENSRSQKAVKVVVWGVVALLGLGMVWFGENVLSSTAFGNAGWIVTFIALAGLFLQA